VELPADLPIPADAGGGAVLLARDRERATAVTFVELRDAPAPAFRTIGSVAFGYRSRSSEDGTGLRLLRRLIELMERQAPSAAFGSAQAASEWLLTHCRDPGFGVSISRWPTER
jgi:hypothetical protein